MSLRHTILLRVRHLVSNAARRKALFTFGNKVPRMQVTEFNFNPGEVPAEVVDKIPLNDEGRLCLIDLAPSCPIPDEPYVRVYGPSDKAAKKRGEKHRACQFEFGVCVTEAELRDVLRSHRVSRLQRPGAEPQVVFEDTPSAPQPPSVPPQYRVVVIDDRGQSIPLDDNFTQPDDAVTMARNLSDANCCMTRVLAVHQGNVVVREFNGKAFGA